LLLDPVAREQLRQQLVVAWFGSFAQPLNALFKEDRGIDDTEIALRGKIAGRPVAPSEPSTDLARSAAFRRIVTEAYDYRCAAGPGEGANRLAPGEQGLPRDSPQGRPRDHRGGGGAVSEVLIEGL
jgi:hypothetical protein